MLNKVKPKELSIISQQVKAKVHSPNFAFAGALPFNPLLTTVRSVCIFALSNSPCSLVPTCQHHLQHKANSMHTSKRVFKQSGALHNCCCCCLGCSPHNRCCSNAHCSSGCDSLVGLMQPMLPALCFCSFPRYQLHAQPQARLDGRMLKAALPPPACLPSLHA